MLASRRLLLSPSSSRQIVRNRPSSSSCLRRRIPPNNKSKSNNNQQQRTTLFSSAVADISSSSPVSAATTTRGKATATAATTTTTSRIANAVVSRTISRQQLVTSPHIQRALPYIGHGAYLALVSGFCMTDMFSLRMALVGGYTGLVAFHSLHPRPLRIPLGWSAVFILVNATAAITLAYDQFGIPLTHDEELLYTEHFSNTLTRGQFYQLMKLGTTHYLTNSHTLTKEGQYCNKLYFLIEGKANVYHHQKFVANIHSGGFINDVAFVATSTSTSTSYNNTKEEDVNGGDGVGCGGAGSYGTVITTPNCKLISWNANELKNHLSSRNDFDRNMKYTLTQHLMQALLNQRETNYEKQKTKRKYTSNSRNTITNTTLRGGEQQQQQQQQHQQQQVGATSAVVKEPLGYFIIEDEQQQQQQQQQQHHLDHNTANMMR